MATEPSTDHGEPFLGQRLVHRIPAMGTIAEITVYGLPCAIALRSIDMLERLESLWSRFRPGSEVSGLNRAASEATRAGTATAPIVVSDATFHLLSIAIDAWRKTEGIFDPTIGTSMEAAGYDRSFELLPAPNPGSQSRLGAGAAKPKPSPGPAGLVLDDVVNTVTLPPGVILDLGGIAKGAAADRLAQDLIDAGADGCCVNIGGDLRVMGTPPRPEGWQVQLDCPGAQKVIHVGIEAGAVCTTSKSRRRWATPGSSGGAEHHLRDPASGAALETGVTSVTVIGASATQAEVLCKAAFAAGLERGPKLVAERGATGLLVGDDGTVVAMPGLDPYRAAALHQVGVG